MSLNRNTAANLAGRVWTGALTVLLIPVYVNLLGIESFALVGFFGTLQAISSLIDFGLGAAFSRELARLSSREGTEQDQRDLLATLNVVYWTLAALVALIIWLAAPLIATEWVNAQSLSTGSIIVSIRLMGIAIAMQLPMSLYQGGLLGLQRQVQYNAVLVGTMTVRSAGVILVLWLVSATIEAFFVWQAALMVLAAVVHWVVLDRVLPRATRRAVFRRSLLGGVFAYAAGWAANTVGIVIAQQLDKIILSKVLPLEQFGYYTLAATVASLLWTLVAPVSAAAFPRFNQRVALGDDIGLAREYDRANQLLAAIVIPVSAVIVFFPVGLMTIWTGRPAVAASTAPLVVLFAVGMTLIGLVNVALHVALSYGWFRLTLGFTWGTAILSAPLFLFAARTSGAFGVAVVWMFQNASYLLLVPLLHRRHLRGSGRGWFKHAILYPIPVAAAVCAMARLIVPPTSAPVPLAAMLAVTWLAAFTAVALIEPDVRAQVFSFLARIRTVPGGA